MQIPLDSILLDLKIMSKNKNTKKKVVVTTESNAKKVKISPTVSRTASKTQHNNQSATLNADQIIFKKQNYMLMAGGFALVLLGMLLMLGGEMPSPDVWDPNIIYNPRITILAPIVILSGLAMEVFAIFKRY